MVRRGSTVRVLQRARRARGAVRHLDRGGGSVPADLRGLRLPGAATAPGGRDRGRGGVAVNGPPPALDDPGRIVDTGEVELWCSDLGEGDPLFLVGASPPATTSGTSRGPTSTSCRRSRGNRAGSAGRRGPPARTRSSCWPRTS